MYHSHKPAVRLLNIKAVCDRLGRCKSAVYGDIAAGKLPRPLRIGGSSRWPEHEIENYIARLTAARDAAASTL